MNEQNQQSATTDASIEQELRRQAEMFDNGTSIDTQPTDAGQAAPADQDGSAPAPTPAAPETAQSQASQAGTDLSPNNEQSQQQQQPQQAQPDKEAKDRDRYDRNWKRFQDEQARFRAEREAFRREQMGFYGQAGATNAPASPQPAGSERLGDKYSAEAIDQAAERLEAQGNYALAEEARAEARYARQRAERAQPQPAAAPAAPSSFEQQRFAVEWKSNLEKQTEQNPELLDQATPLYKTTAEVLNSHRYFRTHSGGINEAVQLAKIMLDARSVPDLRTKLSAAEKENARLRAATSPGTGGVPRRDGPRSFDNLSLAEQASEIRRQAAEHDAGLRAT